MNLSNKTNEKVVMELGPNQGHVYAKPQLRL